MVVSGLTNQAHELNRTLVTQSAEKPEQTNQQLPPEKGAVAGSDLAEVSQLGLSLTKPDRERIEQLRLDVQSGNYEVAAQVVAGAIIDAHLKE